METITNQDLQNIAVQCTTDFFNANIPLSQSLAKQASELSLNTEQIKRAVEATNTLTFLKQASMAADRTSEFPLADFNDVVRIAFMPKQAEDTSAASEINRNEQAVQPTVPKESEHDFDFSDQNVEKSAGLREKSASVWVDEIEDRVKLGMIQKEAMINARALEDCIGRSEVLLSQLQKQASILRADPRGLEKIAAVSEGDEFNQVANLVFGKEAGVQHIGYAQFTVNMKDQAPARELTAMLKQAQELVAEIKYRQDLAERTSLTKQAGLLSNVAGKVGSKSWAAVKNTAGVVANPSTFLGKGIGKVVKAPFKLAGKAVSKTVGGLASVGADFIKTDAQNLAAKTSIGAKLGAKAGTVSPETTAKLGKLKKIGLGAAALGGAGADIAFYHPHVKPEDDKSGDVWHALNG